MRASLLQFVALLSVGILCGCNPSKTHHSVLSESPVIIISQVPDYPIPGHDSEFHGGLVVKLWRDGRIIRAARLDSVGRTYVEGFVEQASREKFFASLGTCAALQFPEGGGVPVDSASETITVRLDGKTSRWTRTLPDKQSAGVSSSLVSWAYLYPTVGVWD